MRENVSHDPTNKFDTQATDQLKALGFKIEDGSDIAILRSVTDARKAMIVTVGLSDHPDFFGLTITVPKGITFRAFVRRADLFDAGRFRCGGASRLKLRAREAHARKESPTCGQL
jgi:hypothetical protein